MTPRLKFRDGFWQRVTWSRPEFSIAGDLLALLGWLARNPADDVPRRQIGRLVLRHLHRAVDHIGGHMNPFFKFWFS